MPVTLEASLVSDRVESFTVTGVVPLLVIPTVCVDFWPALPWMLIWFVENDNVCFELGFVPWLIVVARLIAAPTFRSPAPCCSAGADDVRRRADEDLS